MSNENYTPWDSAELLTDDEVINEYLKAALSATRPRICHAGCRQCGTNQRHSRRFDTMSGVDANGLQHPSIRSGITFYDDDSNGDVRH